MCMQMHFIVCVLWQRHACMYECHTEWSVQCMIDGWMDGWMIVNGNSDTSFVVVNE